jgi:hypothetical protein
MVQAIKDCIWNGKTILFRSKIYIIFWKNIRNYSKNSLTSLKKRFSTLIIHLKSTILYTRIINSKYYI